MDRYTPSVAPTSATDANFFSGTARLGFGLQAKSTSVGSSINSKHFLLNVTLLRCSSCPTAGPDCEPGCAGLATNDMKIKSCSTQVNPAGSGGDLPYLSVASDCAGFGADVGADFNTCKWKNPGTHTFTVPTGVSKIRAVAIGGGGGAGLFGTFFTGGGGGGAAIKSFTVSAGQTVTVVVGSGGAGRLSTTASNFSASNGGSSSVTVGGVSITGGGGTGGKGTASPTTYAGGAGANGDVNCTGGTGARCSTTQTCAFIVAGVGRLCLYTDCIDKGLPGSCGGRHRPFGDWVTGSFSVMSIAGGGYGAAGGGATPQGGEGNDPYGCGSGGGMYSAPTSTSGIKGGDGCVFISW